MTIKIFEDLTTSELYNIIHLRERVFIVEQQCYYLDADGHDLKAWHLMINSDSKLVAYLRILPPNTTYPNPSIGRVVIDKSFRNKKLGRKIMIEAIAFIKRNFENYDIEIGAQTYLNKFYKSLGFKNVGEKYLEDGIPHIHMILQ